LAQASHLLEKLEHMTKKALYARKERPYLGGQPLLKPSGGGVVLRGRKIGYLANVDPARLQRCTDTLNCTVEIVAMPGAFLHQGDVLARLPELSDLGEAECADLLGAFAFNETRTFEQDPLYGMQVLVEIAARALSPGVNDPGSAVLVTDACYKLIAGWIEAHREPPECNVEFPRIRATDVTACAMIEESLGELARYGAGEVLVAERVQAALASLTASTDKDAAACAKQQAAIALARAEVALAFEPDRERVRAAARK
jgi:uncharacterized membrane protein